MDKKSNKERAAPITQIKPAPRKKKRKKKKVEFSKKLVTWSLVITTLCIGASYLLSWTDHDSCQEITVAIITTCIAIAVSYEAKSYGEKNSRNKYGVDENGVKLPPISQTNDGGDEAVG